MKEPSLEAKVAFLSRPQAYPDGVQHVVAKQTHMSWVFLTDAHAWKLKKPVRTHFLDFSTIEARCRNCHREVRLNRRLARDVYLGTVPLSIDHRGDLNLHGRGPAVDWLVWMRRLPGDLMLDELIARHAITEHDMSQIAAVLVHFYQTVPRAFIGGPQYRMRLAADVERARIELRKADRSLATDLVEAFSRSTLKFLEDNAGLFDERVRSGKVVEAHGDLRPEHVCLESPPVIIDCLEFNRKLRTLDVASELIFFALECERLGSKTIGDFVLNKYSEASGDWPPPALLQFYRAYHALVRAQIAIWHLKDGQIDEEPWIMKARQYLDLVCTGAR
jgi:aminoglycoside phosphotransferase family enzyme